MTMMIRNADTKDAKGIAHVHVQSWKTTYQGIVPQSYLDSLDEEESTSRWEKNLVGRGDTFVAVNDESRIVGFAMFGACHDYNADGQVYAIYILKDFQLQGIGALFFQEAVKNFKEKGWETFAVEALIENPSMVFYRKLRPVHYKLSSFTIHGQELREWVMTYSVENVLNQLGRNKIR